jgi:hypothetical protein
VRAVLLYDGSRPVFRAAAESFVCAADAAALPLDSPRGRAFLDAQFDARPFAFVLVEGDRVHAGSETVGRLLRRRGLPGPVAGLAARAYPSLAEPVGRAVHGRAPADLDGTFALTDAAREALAPVREGVRIDVD